MKFTNILLRTEITALISLLIFSAVISVYAGIRVYLGSQNVLTPYETAFLVFMNSLIAGGLVVSIFGAPIYSAMQFKNKANWMTVLLLGIVPGLVITMFDATIGAYAVACGVGVVITTHVFYKKHSDKSITKQVR